MEEYNFLVKTDIKQKGVQTIKFIQLKTINRKIKFRINKKKEQN